MPKKEIKASIKNDDTNNSINTTAIIYDGILKYKENENTKVILDLNNNILIRENNEFRMEYKYDIKKETKGKIFIKELNKEIELKIKTKKYVKKDELIIINFSIENNNFEYRIEG